MQVIGQNNDGLDGKWSASAGRLDHLPMVPHHLPAADPSRFAAGRPRHIKGAQIHLDLLDFEQHTVRHEPVGRQLGAALIRFVGA